MGAGRAHGARGGGRRAHARRAAPLGAGLHRSAPPRPRRGGQLAGTRLRRRPVEHLQLEVTSAGSRAGLAAEVAARFDGAIDLLVVNAGVYKTQWLEPEFTESFAVNYDGATATALALAPRLAPGALVAFVSSGLGKLSYLTPDYAGAITAAETLEELSAAARRYDPASPMPQHNASSPDYSVSKAALNRAVQLLARPGSPLRAARAAVAAVCPGWCRTDMGGGGADRSPKEGAASILWPYEAHAGGGFEAANGSFTRDGGALPW
ncbi:MAG: hypothetical protein J3K34DRAFT_443196 [Monoraphidium minutum]|nr:MAG: hypothetical protein J3K34DRAFT_443196 [Monoraphidium minutum]